MAFSRIIYNSKIIEFPRLPREMFVDATVPRSVNRTLTGNVETLREPRMDVRVSVDFGTLESATLLIDLENWWQWAQQGRVWTFAYDSTRAVNTTLANAEAAGQTVLTLTTATGTTIGRSYVVQDGPNHQVVTVDNIAGSDVTISKALDFDFSSGSKWRERYWWSGVIRDANAPLPFRILHITPIQYDVAFEFFEAQ